MPDRNEHIKEKINQIFTKHLARLLDIMDAAEIKPVVKTPVKKEFWNISDEVKDLLDNYEIIPGENKS